MILHGDAIEQLKTLPAESVQCCVTSPPYWGLRDYGEAGQLGLEATPEEFVDNLVAVMREVKRVLRKDGTLWLNIGDSYAGSGKGANPDGTPHPASLAGKQGTNTGSVTGVNKPQKASDIGLKPKDLCGIPWRVAFALQADGWWLRQDIIWHKPNPMPESCTDRCTKAHEYIFLLTKSAKYYYDNEAVREPYVSDDEPPRAESFNGTRDKAIAEGVKIQGAFPQSRRFTNTGRNKRSVWTITTKPYPGAHFATFPPELPELCIKAGSKEGDTILDPFFGSGTTGWVAQRLMRKWIGIELSEDYIKLADQRFDQGDLFASGK